MLHVTCHVSPVTCLYFFFLQFGGAVWARVCHQWDLPLLFFWGGGIIVLLRCLVSCVTCSMTLDSVCWAFVTCTSPPHPLSQQSFHLPTHHLHTVKGKTFYCVQLSALLSFSRLRAHISAYFSLFQSIPAYTILFQSISTYSSLFCESY